MNAPRNAFARPILLIALTGLVACGQTITEPIEEQPTLGGGKADIYGEDDRAESYTAVDGPRLRMARASAMLADSSDLVENTNDAGEVVGYRLSDSTGSLGAAWGLCEEERFAEQPRVAFCSATLVAPDLVATSGHCIAEENATPEQARCSDVSIVFDFGYDSEVQDPFDSFNNISPDSLYRCERVEAIGWTRGPENHDWALIRLDRAVVDREPMPVLGTPPRIGSPVLQIGHPSGLPQKLSEGVVTNASFSESEPIFRSSTFAYEADLLGGNSGGGVFDLAHDALAGIPTLYSGQNFVWDDARGCYVHGVCGENASCPYPPGGYGTFRMLEVLRADDSPLIDELSVVEGEVGGGNSSLLISEYVEGSGWNKALEVFNPSERDIAPGNCSISIYLDGSTEPSATHESTGTIPALGTFTWCDSRSDIEPSLCDAEVGLGFNGDDTIVARCDGVHMDIFGEVGVDPGDGWKQDDEGGSVDRTLRRGCSHESGFIRFDVWEWTPHAMDDFSDLGQRECDDE